jgi:TetR/AcrR family transcriptional regulator, transcriptional repressor for nem operon
MRQSKEAAAESRRRIVTHAARLFRERGIEGASVVDLMRAAGMTHGGFYKHFASKDELVAEALESAFADIAARFDAAAASSTPRDAAEAYVARYLQIGHIEQPGIGCPVAALGGDVGRAGPSAQSAFEKGVCSLTARLAQGFFSDSADGEKKALALLSTLAGTVMTARSVANPGRREAILAAGNETVRAQLARA